MTDPRSWDAVVMAERFADGLATEAELDAASVVANDIHLDTEGRVKRYAAEAAFQCAALYEEGWQVLIAWQAAALAIEGEALERSIGQDSSTELTDIMDSWAEAHLGSGRIMGWTDANPDADISVLLRCIVGNPFRPVTCDPSWRTSTVVGLAEAIYADRAFDRLPIMADALEDAGCTHPGVQSHCRGDGPHARGCWVIDLILGKA
jgi:hypothetical protein